MSRQYCFLCASDEGVFLDITSDNKQTFYDQLETCTLGKVNTANDSLTKICHKCAYELNQCSSFVRKYKQSCDKLKQKVKVLKYCCSLCLEPGKKGYIFDLQKDRNSASDFFTKINQLFNYNVDKREAKSKLICLTCRYCVDVLYDLKSTFQQTTAKLKDGLNEQIDIVNSPKTKTSVVSRKTTITEPARIAEEISSDSNSDSAIMKHKQSRITKLKKTKSVPKPTTRVCDKCQDHVKKGEDMYRFYISGHTVCKNCWRIADPSKQNVKPRIRRNYAETKLCTILLKDVSTDSSFAERKLDKSEAKKDENIEEPLIVIDSSSENELPQPKLPRKLRRPVVTNVENDVVKPVQKRTTRRTIAADSGSEEKANKKFKSDKEETEVEASKVDEPVAAQEEAVPEKQQNSKKSNARQSNDSVSDSSLPNDVSKSKDSTIANNVSKSKDSTIANDVSKSKDSTIANDVSKSKDSKAHDGVREKRKRGNKASLSDADVELKGNRKKLKTIFEGITTSKTVYLSDGTLSNDDSTSKRKKTRFASVSPVMNDVSGDDKATRSIKSKAGPASSKVAHSRRKIKSASDTTSPTVPTVESDDKEPADANDETNYVCDECGNRYENKLDNLTHKLTHSKQPQLKLEKVVLQDAGKTASVSPAAEETEEQCDAIEISVDDDEEESTTGDMNNSHGNDKVITDSNNVVDQECSSEKEAVEDAIDTKLVIEESDEQGEDNEKSNLDTASTKESVEKDDTDSAVKTSEKVTDHDSNEKSKKKDGGNNETSKETDKHVEVDDNRKENEDTSDTTEKEKEPTNQKETENTKIRLEEEEEDEAEIDVVEDDKEKTQRDSKERKKDKEAAEEDKDDAKKDTEEAEEDAEEAKKDAEEAEVDKGEAEGDKEEAEVDKEEAEGDKEKEEGDKEEAEVDKEAAQEETEKDEEVAKDKEETEDKDAEDEAEEDKEVAEDKEETGDKDEEDEKSDSQTPEEKCSKDFNLVVEEDEPEVITKNGSQVVEEKDDESETDIRIVDTGSFDDCVEQNLPESTKDCEDDEVNVINDDDDSGDLEITDENVKCKRSAGKGENTSQNTITLSSEDEDEDDEVEVTESTVPKPQKRGTDSKKRKTEVLGEDDEVKATESKVPKSQKKKTDSKKRKTEVLEEDDEVNVTESNVPKSQKKKSDSKKGTTEVLQEVFALASAEVQKRQVTVVDETNSTVVEPETLENISREVNSLMVKN